MNNQMILRAMYDSAIKIDENELYHHGVEGMSWGDRNGPPYPLSGANKKEARAEAKAKIEREKRLDKMRKAAAKKRKIQAKEQKKQAKIDKMKIKLMQKGDMKGITKKAKYFTNEEIEWARERNRQLVEAHYTKDPKKAPDPHAMEKLMNVVSKVGTIAQAAVPVVTLMRGASELKNMGIERELKLQRAQNDATESQIKLIKEFDPESAAKLTGKYTGMDVKYKPKKDEMKPADVRTVTETLLKVNPQAAAKYLKDQTGYGGLYTAGSGKGKGSETKNVKGNMNTILSNARKISLGDIAKKKTKSQSQEPSTTKPEGDPNVKRYLEYLQGPTKKIKTSYTDSAITQISGILGGSSSKKVSEIPKSSSNLSKAARRDYDFLKGTGVNSMTQLKEILIDW